MITTTAFSHRSETKIGGGIFVDLLPEQEVANKDQIKVINEEIGPHQQQSDHSTPGPGKVGLIFTIKF